MKLNVILKKLAKNKKLSIAELSRQVQIPQQTLNNWLQGLEPKNLSQVKKVADYFNVTLDYLCFGEISEHKNNNLIDNIIDYENEINAGIFEVVLRRIKK